MIAIKLSFPDLMAGMHTAALTSQDSMLHTVVASRNPAFSEVSLRYVDSALDTDCGLRQDVPNTAPVWLSEIGLTVQQFDPADGNADDTRWWRCLRAWMARHDIDWGFWALQVRLSVF